MKKSFFREWLSTYIAKKPRTMVLLGIIVFNVVFVVVSAVIISYLSPDTLEGRGFGASLFFALAMLLDPGSLHEIIGDIGKTRTIIIVVCMLIVILGMFSFTAAVIGYITTYISNFIDNVNAGKRKLRISNHTIIINWNSRAPEIINELLFSEKREKVVILVDDDIEPIEREIRERIEDSLTKEKKELEEECKELGFIESIKHKHKYKTRNKLTVIVRNGDAYSSKQLSDISVKRAKAVIILNRDVYHKSYKCSYVDGVSKYEKGNADTIKTLVQVAYKTGKESSADNQKVIVEVEDDWTMELAEKIIRNKEEKGKSSIVPVLINRVLGEILAQFSIMPELNTVYDELLSNKNAEFYCKRIEDDRTEVDVLRDYMNQNRHSIPVSVIERDSIKKLYCVTDREKDIHRIETVPDKLMDINLNNDFWLDKKNIIILGHNSKSYHLMEAFDSFRNEWNYKNGDEILNILIIDDEKHLAKMKHYKDYPYVTDIESADIYDKEKILSKIKDFIRRHKDEDVSILILSDDAVKKEEMDTNALTYLIYVQDILMGDNKMEELDSSDGRVDIIVEILNPKNYDVVRHYSVDNVVISNKYVSKLVTQIGEKDDLYELYADMLTYDDAKYDDNKARTYDSKEIYVKKASDFFAKDCIPEEAAADVLIRSVYGKATKESSSVLLGYINKNGETIIFAGDKLRKPVKLTSEDKLIVYSNH